jgi:protein-disulfide isomerase
MHDALFDSQEQWSGNPDAVTAFKKLAGDLDLDQTRFDACLDEGAYADQVAADTQEGMALGISGTPAFSINGALLSGAQPFAAFQKQIDYYLAGGEPPKLEVSADSFRSLGNPDAPVVVTEFSDFQCPACGAVAREVIPEFIKQYVDTGKARLVFRDFPLSSIHPAAQKAAEAAVCAGKLGKYWEMNEKLFAAQDEWEAQDDPLASFKAYAQEMGLDSTAFEQCLDSDEAAVQIQGDLLAGETLGVNATPYFFIDDLPIRGGLPLESMGEVVDYVAAGGPTPEIVPLGEDWHVRGDPQSARAITVAFVDYTSPESRQHATEVLPELMKTYVDSGSLVYILHPWSDGADSLGAQAATAAECAGQQGKFWEMHEQLFKDQATWTPSDDPRASFAGYAESQGLDADQFLACLDSDWAKLRVQAGKVVGLLYGVPSAPVFLFSNGQGQQGSPSLEEFKTIIDSMLNP